MCVIFTARGYSILQGAPASLGLTHEEAARALILADVMLASLMAGWATAKAPNDRPTKRAPIPSAGVVHPLRVLFTMPIGLYFLVARAYLPGSGGENQVFTTSYQVFAMTWPGLLLIAFVYTRGFRWYLMLPLATFLLLMGVQGQSRYRLILPTIILFQILLDRRDRRWPPIWMVVTIMVLGFVFLPSEVTRSLGTPGNAHHRLSPRDHQDLNAGGFPGREPRSGALRPVRCFFTLSDQRGSPLYGEHYLNLLALPIPRPMWPEKPGLADHIKGISTDDRPLGTIGAVLTLPGELYLDFRVPGIIIVGFLFGRLTGRFYLIAYRQSYGALVHFFYLLLASSLIQVYRDGLISIPVFLIVNSAPLMMIVTLHYMVRKPRGRVISTDRLSVADIRRGILPRPEDGGGSESEHAVETRNL